mgnify:CR=1 FL=1|tara:strand:+ start:364 stop:696 length:333 start_codon:yes stop_codon:yes gene_type:complete
MSEPFKMRSGNNPSPAKFFGIGKLIKGIFGGGGGGQKKRQEISTDRPPDFREATGSPATVEEQAGYVDEGSSTVEDFSETGNNVSGLDDTGDDTVKKSVDVEVTVNGQKV